MVVATSSNLLHRWYPGRARAFLGDIPVTVLQASPRCTGRWHHLSNLEPKRRPKQAMSHAQYRIKQTRMAAPLKSMFWDEPRSAMMGGWSPANALSYGAAWTKDAGRGGAGGCSDPIMVGSVRHNLGHRKTCRHGSCRSSFSSCRRSHGRNSVTWQDPRSPKGAMASCSILFLQLAARCPHSTSLQTRRP